MMLAAPKIEAAQSRIEVTEAEDTAALGTLAETALRVFFIFSGLVPAVLHLEQGRDFERKENRNTDNTDFWVKTRQNPLIATCWWPKKRS